MLYCLIDLGYSPASTRNTDDAHSDVALGGTVAVEADTETAAEIHGDLAENKTVGTREPQTEVRVASHCEVRNLDIVLVGDLDSASTRSEAGVDSSTALEDLAGSDRDRVGANRAGGNDGDTLAGADGVDGGLNSSTVV